MNRNRVNYNSNQMQQVTGMGGTQFFKHTGECVLCGGRVFGEFDNALSGVSYDPDPRGFVDVYHAQKTLVAREFGASGPDVIACYHCTESQDHYNQVIALARKFWSLLHSGAWSQGEE